ncbi:MAG: hemerythrin domain-containing protein [Bryobacterales bacterium]|nr:hemerythrin domain-containing protein [Bryobacterales bacterium]
MISIRLQPETVATPDQPLDHLVACHRRIEERLDTLERAAAHLAGRRGEALAAIRNACAFLESSGAIHTRDEEESLFPRLPAQAEPLVRTLAAEHEEAERLYGILKDLVNRIEAGETLDAEYRSVVGPLVALYREHIRREDSELIDVSRAALTGEDLSAIAAEMRQRRGL